MSRKKRKFEREIPDIDKYISQLKYRDLKRECVIREMPFENVVAADIPGLSSYLEKNFMVEPKHELLEIFDEWQEDRIRESMESKGQDPSDVISPSLRLGFVSERDDDGNVTKRKRVKTIFKRKKKKRERTSEGLFSGTKKAYTFSLQKQGKTKAEVIKLVLETFPDASEKSIGIWFNKAKKL